MREPKSDPAESHQKRLLRNVAAGYRNLFSLLADIVPLVGTIVVLSAVVVLPLWYLATYHRGVYTLLVAAFALAGLGYLLLRRIRRGGVAPRRLGKSATVLAAAAAILGTVRLFALGNLLLGFPLLLIAVLLTGAAGSPKKRV